MKWTINRLLVLVFALAILLVVSFVLPRRYFYHEVRAMKQLLKGLDIADASVGGFHEGLRFNVIDASFRVKGKPNSIIVVYDENDEKDRLFLTQIGSWWIRLRSCDRNQTIDRLGIQLSQRQAVAELLGSRVHSIEDVVNRYDAIDKHLAELQSRGHHVQGRFHNYNVEWSVDIADELSLQGGRMPLR